MPVAMAGQHVAAQQPPQLVVLNHEAPPAAPPANPEPEKKPETVKEAIKKGQEDLQKTISEKKLENKR